MKLLSYLKGVKAQVILFSLLAASIVSNAATKTWNGSTSTDWYNGANWTPSGVPGFNDSVVFSASATGGCLLTANEMVGRGK